MNNNKFWAKRQFRRQQKLELIYETDCHWRGILASALATAYASAPEPIENYDPLHTPAPQAQRANQGLITGIAQHGEHFIAVGGFGTIIEFNNPANWQQREVPTSVLLTAIHAVDDEHIWVAGHDGVLLQSTDGGQSWQMRLDGHQLLALEYEWLQERQIELEDAMKTLKTNSKQKNWSLSSTSCFSILAVPKFNLMSGQRNHF